MKKTILLCIAMCTVICMKAQTTDIPDPNFEQALVDQMIDTDGIVNGEVLTADISVITTLDVSAANITNLTGIADFTALQVLYCDDNNLTSLDVSALVNLTDLNCSNNNLGAVDVSQNPALLILRCSNSGISTLDITANPQLLELYVSFNQLTSLDTSFNAGLNVLQCSNNQLTSLDVTAAGDLLVELLCSGNQLEGTIDLSQNNALVTFNGTGNSSLYCIQVANAADAEAGINQYAMWSEDAFAVYSENCADIVTYVPDDAFEEYLINQGVDDELDNYVLTVNIEPVISVDVTSAGVADLTGIEDFVNLEELYCSGNTLTSLDISQNNLLLVLECSNNQLTDIVLNTALTSLICDGNQLTSLDVSQNTDLNTLNCDNNQLSGSLILNGLNLLVNFDSTNNPDLVCIQVDNATDADDGTGQYATWSKDMDVIYSVDCALSSDDFSLEDSTAVYPNPASSIIHLELPHTITVEKIVVYDMQGKKIIEGRSKTINVESLLQGLYFVEVQTATHRRFHKKILISRD